jgi:glycerol-3-phosphate dehydrogenase
MVSTNPKHSFDVAIIGGGVIGAAIAMRLSLTTARVCLLEQADDLAEGASKANSGIAQCGYDTAPGSLETRLVRASSPRWEDLSRRLDVPFKRLGSLSVAITDQQAARLPQLKEVADANGVSAELLSGEQARGLEPLITPACKGALFLPDEGIIDPLRLTFGYAELAAHNGSSIFVSSPVTGFRKEERRIKTVVTPRLSIDARYVVNAAGVLADTISMLAGGDAFRMWPRKGQFWIMDREFGSQLQHIVVGAPTPTTRGVLVVPTTHGSALLGPTAEDVEDRSDKATEVDGLHGVFEKAQALVPSVSLDYAIKTFAGARPASDPVYRINRDPNVPNLVHAAAIRSTGVSSSPAVADMVLELLRDSGLSAKNRDDAVQSIPRIPRLLFEQNPDGLAEVDRRYRQVVCVCEQVTAAEIAAALSAKVPARSIEGVRKRTRATGGRCQGSVCMAGVSFMCSLHLNLPPEQLTFNATEGATLGVGRSSFSLTRRV